jgi:hypothetical protein
LGVDVQMDERCGHRESWLVFRWLVCSGLGCGGVFGACVAAGCV